MKVKFTCSADKNKDIKNVFLAGSFNNWQAGKNPMKYNKKTGLWEKQVELAQGSYPYKFIINGEDWVHDPDAERYVQNDIGTLDSIKLVKPKNPFHRRFRPVHPTLDDKITFYSTKKATLLWGINGWSLGGGGNMISIENITPMKKDGNKKRYKCTIGPFNEGKLPEVILYSLLYKSGKIDDNNGRGYWLPVDLKVEGEIKDLTIKSNALKEEVDFRIYLPKGYEESSKKFPLLILIHGYGGTCKSDWTQQNIIRKIADRAGIVLLWPDGNVNVGKEKIPSWYINSTADKGAKMEDYIIKELIPFMQENFKVKREKKSYGIAGISMGGFGTFYLATKYNEYFRAAASFSALYNLHKYKKIPAVKKLVPWGTWKDQCFNVEKLVKKSQNCDYYFIIGDREYGAIEGSIKLKNIMEKKNIPHEFHVYPGDHTNNFWRRHIQEMMEYIEERIAK